MTSLLSCCLASLSAHLPQSYAAHEHPSCSGAELLLLVPSISGVVGSVSHRAALSHSHSHMAGMANTAPRPCLFTHSQSHTHIHSLSLVRVAMMRSKELKTKTSHAHSLIPSHSHSVTLTHTHSHTLTITCTCCYDEIKGAQDLKIYSHADSLFSGSLALTHFVSLCRSRFLSGSQRL